jgi:predicted GNAT superfamily acetyltransferase
MHGKTWEPRQQGWDGTVRRYVAGRLAGGTLEIHTVFDDEADTTRRKTWNVALQLSGRTPMTLRDAQSRDLASILELNAESERFLSPLTVERLEALHRAAAYHKVIEIDDTIAAFLLAFREGAPYDSPNYLWFVERYPKFLYIDRVVVAPDHRGGGFGAMLYDDIAAFAARAGVPWLACEFDIEPPNPASQRFHERMGFHEVGTQAIGGGRTRVSLQAKPVAASGG